MSLLVKEVDLRNFRNVRAREISLGEGMNVLVGRNATGKTNTVEALQLLTTGTSFRHPRPAELLREGEVTGRASARLEGDGRVVDVELDLTPERKSFSRNGKACRPQALPGTLMSILFSPDDLSFVKGSASFRRQEVDGFGCQANRGYDKVVRTYSRAVEQRNRLLKEECPDRSLLDAWDESVALGGATLLVHRMSLFRRLSRHVEAIYGEISGGEALSCSYESSLGADVASLDREHLRDLFVERLKEGREEDRRRQVTLVGPQRDDISFSIDGRPARAFGSQGQQRTIALSWKMAEVRLSSEILGDQPLLLLDDVMSELDEVRRSAVTEFVQAGIQTVVTTANLGYFPKELLDGARVVRYGG